MKITNLAVHNSGGMQSDPFAFTQKQTLEQLNEAHRLRWPEFRSSLGYWIGYNLVVFPNGKWVQTRKIGEATAAVKGHNEDTFSVLLPGNFNLGKEGWLIEAPMPAQVETLKMLEERALDETLGEILQIIPGTEIDIKFGNIGPHRQWGQTDCYGTSLKDDWARELVRPHLEKKIGLLSKIISLYYQILDLLRKQKMRLGGIRPVSCLDDAR